MESVRLGRVVRALRQRRGWRQSDLAGRVGVSQSLIARVERGGAHRLTVERLEAIALELGARLLVRVDWNGEAADRLLDAGHAALVEHVIDILRRSGWEPVPEVTFAVGTERGSIDILAWHASSATLLVVEVKSVVPDMQGMLAPFDRKVRLADGIARARGWRPGHIATLLVIAESRTSRRRIEAHAATLDSRFPHRAREIRRFIADPTIGPIGGIWFLSPRTTTTARHRVVSSRSTPRA